MSMTSTAALRTTASRTGGEEHQTPSLVELAIRCRRAAGEIGQIAIDLSRLTGLQTDELTLPVPPMLEMPAIALPGDPNHEKPEDLLDTSLQLLDAGRTSDLLLLMRGLNDERLEQFGKVAYNRVRRENGKTTISGQASQVPAHLVNILQIYAEEYDQRPQLASRRGRRAGR